MTENPAHPAAAPAQPASSPARLSAWETWLIVLLGALLLGFGGYVVNRAAFLKLRMTDLDVFTRAAWAARQGLDIYDTYSDRSWNYVYPSFFAVAMIPLAEPPSSDTFAAQEKQFREQTRRINLSDAQIEKGTAAIRYRGDTAEMVSQNDAMPVYLPFWAIASIWYALSLVCVFFSAHWIARAIELTSPTFEAMRRVDETLTPAHRAWWTLRLWPAVFLLPAIGNGLTRGQTDALVLACVSGFILLTVRRKPFAAGIVLAIAAAIKVIPALLILYPLWRRDWRGLAGFAMGCVVCLLVIPAIVFGPEKAWAYNLRWLEIMGLPGIAGAASAADTSRQFELYGLAGTDSQSPLAILHNLWNWSTPRGLRPEAAETTVRLLAAGIGIAALLLTLWAARWRPREPGTGVFAPPSTTDRAAVGVIGLLLVSMLLLSPVTHTHYFSFMLPLVAWLVSRHVTRETGGLTAAAWLIGGVLLLTHTLPRISSLITLQEIGVMTLTALAIGAVGVVTLRANAGELRSDTSC